MPRVRALLIEAARERHAVTYAGLLGRLGLQFTRPKMRALCRTLSRIDGEAAALGEPELAVLVVRQSDMLPGQGWWTGHAAATGYAGDGPVPGSMGGAAIAGAGVPPLGQRHCFAGRRCRVDSRACVER